MEVESNQTKGNGDNGKFHDFKRHSMRAIWVPLIIQSIVIVALCIVVGLLVSNSQTASENAVRKAEHVLGIQCSFWSSLGTAPVISSQTSELGAKLIIYSRDIYIEADCGKLSAPSSQLVQVASKYHLDLRG